ncbi:hypothetical protein BH11BAC5_BH11BAC5_37560 [soil metagenome]
MAIHVNDIRVLIDNLVPRGGEKPSSVYVSLEEYLSRLANFNRKIAGINYRIQTWEKVCEENEIEFKKRLNSLDNESMKYKTFTLSSRDSRLESEFEVLLYSLASTLSSMTRIVGCFLEGSTQIHSHTGLSSVLSKYHNFSQTYQIAVDACSLWGDELTKRRDAATHYIALSVTSFIQITKKGLNLSEKCFAQIQIPKYPTKYNSLWEDVLPTLEESTYSRLVHEDGKEIHELKDQNGIIIVKREKHLEKRPELIEARQYVQNLCSSIEEYIQAILNSLLPKLKTQKSGL